MTVRERFDALVSDSSPTTDALDALWADLGTLRAEEMLGAWRGGALSKGDGATGHPAGRLLSKIGWHGKRFDSLLDGHPLICRSEDGELYSNTTYAVGDGVSGIEVGDHVVLSFRSCRGCENCKNDMVGYGDSSLLLNYMGVRMDGTTTYSRDGEMVFGNFFGQSSLSQYAIAYADKSVDLTKVAPYGCGFQTGAGTVLNVLKPTPADSLVVFGCGAVGLSALALVALGLGAEEYAIDAIDLLQTGKVVKPVLVW